MKKITLVNIYNFIRMSHKEPSRFIQADFDTVARQMRLLKQYGLPATWALKYDALTDSRYQKLLLEHTDANDEIGAWWEITEPLCQRAGVPFPGKNRTFFDERVDTAYSVGYPPEDRKRLVDAYMKDFFSVFGHYPKTMGSWVLDSVTLSYAHNVYGVLGGAICRDQMGTDGFTLWGGFPNGVYYPSLQNEFLPAQTKEGQLPVAMFRLLSPDPVYSFEQDVRNGLSGVYTLEPCCQNGRDPSRISWFFSTLIREDGAGIGYAQVGQENNFLWENIRPGFEPQLKHLSDLSNEGLIRLETMAESASWFREKYALTPPAVWQASQSWNTNASLGCQWYATRYYRIGFLAENGHLRIRDWFLYDQSYPSRYLFRKLEKETEKEGQPGSGSASSTMDALPVLFPQKWMKKETDSRPFVRLLEPGCKTSACEEKDFAWWEPTGECRFSAPDEFTACASLQTRHTQYRFLLSQDSLLLETLYCPSEGSFALVFDLLPVFKYMDGKSIFMEHHGFSYHFTVEQGQIHNAGTRDLRILSENGKIRLRLSQNAVSGRTEDLFTRTYLQRPSEIDSQKPRWLRFPSSRNAVPPFPPVFTPPESVFPVGASAAVRLSVPEPNARIRWSANGQNPETDSSLYTVPISLTGDFLLTAVSLLPDGRKSERSAAHYRFGWKDILLKSATVFDGRPVFCGGGIDGLLQQQRGSLDYQDGHYLATLEDLDVICLLPEERLIHTIEIGFLSHHRSGIVYPESVELYLGDSEDTLRLVAQHTLPYGPAEREIAKQDIGFHPNARARCLRFVARRYAVMPQWCCYKGVPDVFLLMDNLIIN